MGIIRNWWREILIALLFVVCFVGCEVNQHHSSANKVLMNQKDSAFNVVRIYVDKNGELTNQIAIYDVTVDELERAGILKDQELERLKKQVGDLNNLVGYWKAEASVKGKFSTKFKDTTRVVKGGDSVNAPVEIIDFKTFDWTNGYLSIHEDYYPADDTVAIDYIYNPGKVEMAVYKRKTTKKERQDNSSIGKRQTFADLKFGDPAMEVSKLTGVVVKEEERRIKWWHWLLGGVGIGLVIDELKD